MQELGLKGEAGGGQKDKIESSSSRQRAEFVQRQRTESTHRGGWQGNGGREAGISRGWGGARVQGGEEMSSGPRALKRSWSLSGNLVAGWTTGAQPGPEARQRERSIPREEERVTGRERGWDKALSEPKAHPVPPRPSFHRVYTEPLVSQPPA